MATPAARKSTATAAAAGDWRCLHALSRHQLISLRTSAYLATSLDQRKLGSSSVTACSMLALSLANWLLRHPAQLPSPLLLDTLLRNGSRRWKRLLSLPPVQAASLPDGFQDLHTLFTHGWAASMPLSIDHHHSYTAFFRPPAATPTTHDDPPFFLTDDCLTFDHIWRTFIAPCIDTTFIVGWNGHFFVLHTHSDGTFYVLDTLGSRLVPQCDKAYVLKFDSGTKFSYYQSYDDHVDTDVDVDVDVRMDDPSSKRLHLNQRTILKNLQGLTSAEACRIFFKDFLAAFSIQEAYQDFKKGLISEVCLLNRLQIDFTAIKNQAASSSSNI